MSSWWYQDYLPDQTFHKSINEFYVVQERRILKRLNCEKVGRVLLQKERGALECMG